MWAAMDTVDRPVLKLSPYPDAQHRHLARFQGQPVTVLEIGVYQGGSLQMWRSYFGDRATIVGADVDPACKAHEGDRIHVRIGDQEDPDFLAELDDEFGPFDVIIDDGGHTMTQQLTTFETLWPRLATPGVYVCEDTATSYSTRYGGGRGASGTFMQRAYEVIDAMHEWWGGEPTDLTRSVASVCCYPSLVVIEKAAVGEPQLIGSMGQGIARGPIEDIRDW